MESELSIAAVLFDKDGTLIDFDLTWGPATYEVIKTLARGDEALARRQSEVLHFDWDVRRFRSTSPLIGGSSADYGPGWAKALGRDDVAVLKLEIDALTAAESLRALTPIGDPKGVLENLFELGLRLGVATNDSEAGARRQIHALGIQTRVEFIAGYDSGYGRKPEPGMILAFARHCGLRPHEIAMVGDTRHDLDAARAAGAVAVAVLSGPAGRADLEPFADHVLAEISELPRLFEGLNPTTRISRAG